MTDAPLNLQLQHELNIDIAGILLSMLHPGMPAVDLRVSALGRMIFYKTFTPTADGFRSVDVPDGLGPLLSRLRKAMYRPGVGTWFTMQMSVELPSRMTADFGKDDQPTFGDRQPSPSAYADELRLYPRAPEHIPTWLSSHLPPSS